MTTAEWRTVSAPEGARGVCGYTGLASGTQRAKCPDGGKDQRVAPIPEYI